MFDDAHFTAYADQKLLTTFIILNTEPTPGVNFATYSSTAYCSASPLVTGTGSVVHNPGQMRQTIHGRTKYRTLALMTLTFASDDGE